MFNFNDCETTKQMLQNINFPLTVISYIDQSANIKERILKIAFPVNH